MKTLGLIGGTSWHSTLEYYRLINEIVESKTGIPRINPPLIIHSLSIDLMRRQDWNKIQEAYLDVAQKMENAGAEALVICANTPHKVIPFVEPKLGIPFIHIADAIGQSANSLNLKNLGILATNPVTYEGYIKDRVITSFDVEVTTPVEASQEIIHRIIVDELTQGMFKEETREKLITQMSELKETGCDGIILGCTELPIILQEDDFDLPMLETTKLHAQMAAEFILS